MSQENEDRGHGFERDKASPKNASEVNQSPVAQELQLNIKEKEEKMQQDTKVNKSGFRDSPVFASLLHLTLKWTQEGRGEAAGLRKT